MLKKISEKLKRLRQSSSLEDHTPVNNIDFDISKLAIIGCSPRSGSTLLIRILDSHSKIAAPCEIGFPKYFKGDKKGDKILKKYQEICRYYGTSFSDCQNNPKILMQSVLARESKEFLVIKEPRQSLFLNQIEIDFPGIKYVHLVRDVRSIATSGMFEQNPAQAFHIWYDYNTAVQRTTNMLSPQRVCLIRYEDVVQNPMQTISTLTTFLGYEYEPDMLDYSRFKHADEAMKLWDGETPAQSKLHSALRNQQISLDIMKDRSNYSKEICEIYQSLSYIKKLNESFGYSE